MSCPAGPFSSIALRYPDDRFDGRSDLLDAHRSGLFRDPAGRCTPPPAEQKICAPCAPLTGRSGIVGSVPEMTACSCIRGPAPLPAQWSALTPWSLSRGWAPWRSEHDDGGGGRSLLRGSRNGRNSVVRNGPSGIGLENTAGGGVSIGRSFGGRLMNDRRFARVPRALETPKNPEPRADRSALALLRRLRRPRPARA
jgi:hypothetical protein